MLAALCACLIQTPNVVEIHISKGRFVERAVRMGSESRLRLVNDDADVYTIEAPGLLPGDVALPAKTSVEVDPLFEAGKFTAMIEEIPSSEVEIRFSGRPEMDPLLREPLFDVARRHNRQPLLFEPGQEPAYGAYTTFNISAKGESGRQEVLQELYRLQERLSGDAPPVELAPYMNTAEWARLRSSVSMTTGLGPSAYDARRFGARVAYSKPNGLHPFLLGAKLKSSSGGRTSGSRRIARGEGLKLNSGSDSGPMASGARDVVVRVMSDNYWFNLRVCRLVWSRLGSRIASPTLEAGYAPPHGRSPILGGFFDGIGNSTGADRDQAVYGKSNGSFLALFRIRFDEARFTALSLAQQEALVGRRMGSGHLIAKGSPNGHRERAQNDGKSLIVRMPLIFDEGPGNTGLLFASVQASIDKQFERILSGFMLAKDQKGAQDSFLSFMRFDEAAYYYIPPSYPGSYPGSLRGM